MYHVLKAAGGVRNLSAYRYDKPNEAHTIRVLESHPAKDLVVLEIENSVGPYPGLARGQSRDLKQLDQVVICGFPNYQVGEEPLLVQANVSGMRTYGGIPRFLVNMPMYPGASGGPVLYRDTVVGVVSTGSTNTLQALTTENHAAIRIEELPAPQNR